MKKIALILLLLSFYRIQAQKNDTITVKPVVAFKEQRLNLSGGLYKITETNRRIESLLLPAAFIAYGFVSLENDGLQKLDNSTKIEIKEDHPGPVTKLDNYLQFSPAAAVYVLNTVGIKGKNNLRDRSMIYCLSNLIMGTTVYVIKNVTKVPRPDGSGNNSFPSGHTATAFAAAEFMRQEYKDVSPWYGIAGYTAATATGILRLYNNKHWVSDVVAGAGVGILSTKLAYWIYPVIKRKLFKTKPMNAMLMPYYQNGGGGVSMVYNFRH